VRGIEVQRVGSLSVPRSDEPFASAILEAADDAIYGLALSGTVRSWNPGAERIFGYAADEIVGTNAVRLLAPDSPNDLFELLERVGRGETVRGYETQVYTRDARVLRAVASFAPIYEAGEITAAAVVLHEQGEVQDHERNRRAAEERFRAILDIAPVALLIVDDHGRLEFANPKAAELFGYDRYELLALELTDLLPDRVASRRRSGDSDELVGPPDGVGLRRDGSEFPVELGVNTLSDGRRRLIAAAIVDLSARRAAEETLREVARQQAAIADLGRRALEGIAPDVLLDEAARLVARVLDVELAEVVELTPDDRLAVRAGAGWRPGIVGGTWVATGTTTPAGAAFRASEPLIVPDLTAEPHFETPAYLRDHGAVAAICCAVRAERARFGVLSAYATHARAFTRHDATFIRGIANVLGAAVARRRSEEELRSTSETLSTLIAAAPVGVAVLDVAGRVQVWNPAAEALFGVAAVDVADRELIGAAAADGETAELVRRVLGGETIRDLDTAHLRPDGSELAIRVHGGPLRDAGGAIVGAVLVLADTSATRRLEEQLLQAQKMESVGRLAGGVAHDFNNLLTGIFGYTSLLADELRDADPDQRDLVRGIRESAEKAAALTAQLLAFSRRQVLQPRVVDVNEVIRGIEPMLRRIIGETVTLVTVPRTRIGPVRADPTQLEQVVVNLVVNARDAMPEGGTVVIETDEVTFDEAYAQEHFDVSPGAYVMLAVTDAGVGMDADTRLHLFEPFFTTKGPGKGTGLGLATTYGIVKQSGGHIWLYSEQGRGTTFKLYFPRVSETADVVTATPEPTVAPAADETVLLVEDETAVREITRIVLARHGYRVLVAENGATALALADAHPGQIDLLITDVVMPGIGGRALAEQLQERRPGLRTLYISGYTEDAIVRQGVLEANVAFLAKPFSPDHLARTVRETLHGPDPGARRFRSAAALEGGRQG
jgi:PAS domain S-box-containing protein